MDWYGTFLYLCFAFSRETVTITAAPMFTKTQRDALIGCALWSVVAFRMLGAVRKGAGWVGRQ
jgi:hypothetical protein